MNHIDPNQPMIPSNLRNPHIADNLDTVRCQVCRATGMLYQEHADGSLSEQVCPYCKGAKNSVWIKERFDDHFLKIDALKTLIWGYGAFLFWTDGYPVRSLRMSFWTSSAGAKYFHFGLFLVLFAGLVWMYLNPSPKKRKKVRGPNPLTTDKEKLLGAAVLGGALLKHEHEHKQKNLEADLDRHIAQYGIPQPRQAPLQSTNLAGQWQAANPLWVRQMNHRATWAAEQARRDAWNRQARGG
jgi:hypothetical protein